MCNNLSWIESNHVDTLFKYRFMHELSCYQLVLLLREVYKKYLFGYAK